MLQLKRPVLQVEFNKAALSLSDSIPADQKKAALNRLLKVQFLALLLCQMPDNIFV